MSNVGIGNVLIPELVPGIACAVLVSALVVAAPAPSRAEPPKLPVPAIDQSAIAQRGYFYVGGKYTGEPGKEIMQGQIYVEVLAPEGCATALSARAHPRRGADRHQLDGNAGWAQGLGGIFRRARLRRLHDRPADARPLGLASGGRRDAHVHRPAGRVPVHRQCGQGHLGAGEETHAMAGGRSEQGPERRSDLRRVLRHAGRDRHLQRGDPATQPGCRRRPARQDRTGNRTDAFTIRRVRLVDRRRAAAARQGDRRNRAGRPSIRSHDHRHRQGARMGPDRHPDHLRSAGEGPGRARG